MDNVIAPPAMLPGAPGGVDPDAAAVPQRVEAGYGASLDSGVAGFAASLERAAGGARLEGPSPITEAMFAPLEKINGEAVDLVDYAQSAVASGNELTPSEIVSLTARSHEFMFHAQLTANVANRTADGLQQLFRQQS